MNTKVCLPYNKTDKAVAWCIANVAYGEWVFRGYTDDGTGLRVLSFEFKYASRAVEFKLMFG